MSYQPNLETKMALGAIDLADIAGAADIARERMVDLLVDGGELSAVATEAVVGALEELDAVVTALAEWLVPRHATAMTLH